MGDLVRFPTRPKEPEVILMRLPDSDLFIIVCDHVQVCGPLDPIGQRELIRKAALYDSLPPNGEEK
jgi:hypothetical protein